MNTEEIGKYILKLRKEKGLTQEELASRVFVTNKAVSRWENGKSLPEVETLYLLSEELGVSINEILSAGENTKEDVKKYYNKKRIKDIIPDILVLLFIFLIPIIFINNSGIYSVSIFLAHLNLDDTMYNTILNAYNSSNDFLFSLRIEFIISWILVIFSYIGYKCKNKLLFYSTFIINILIIVTFLIFSIFFPNTNIIIGNILLEFLLLIINIMELYILKDN